MNTLRIFFTWLALALLVIAMLPTRASAQTFVADNPSCTDLGYDFGFKPQPEPPPSGTYTFPDGVNTVVITSDGIYADWVSTLGIDAVLMKGGPNANLYTYDPEAFSDTGLHSPTNPNNGQFYAISHIEFCYDYELNINGFIEPDKSIETSFTRTYEWTITKTVDPAELSMFAGETGTSGYDVSVQKTGYTDSDWKVSGAVYIQNPAPSPFTAVITGVTDDISPGGYAPAVSCEDSNGSISFPYTLAAGDQITCSFSNQALPDASTRTNTWTVTVDPASTVKGGSFSEDIVFGDPTTEVNASINVDDTNGETWATGADATWTYNRDFSCSPDPAAYTDGSYSFTHDNTATINETGQSDDASVTVNCYAPTLSKTAETTFTRTWNWTIDKSADQTELTLSVGQQFLVNYVVDVGPTFIDSNWKVEGTITVNNPHPSADMTVSLRDVVSPDIAAVLACGGTLAVPAGGSNTCTYSADLPDGSDRTNTATATLNEIDFSTTEDVTFGDPTDVVDECIDVSDTNVGALGAVCADALPVTFSYSLYVGPYDTCGEYTVTNVASFVTNDTGTTGSDSWTITVRVPCDDGCTLTPGYWKTHSEFGPAPYDDTWAQLPNGASTPFFLSGQTYYQVLWTPPVGGNAYYILAHAYIAAGLNRLNGASIPTEVLDAFNQATTVFNTYTPAQVAAFKGQDKAIRDLIVALAYTLDDYNNGLTGPGHCSEETVAAPAKTTEAVETAQAETAELNAPEAVTTTEPVVAVTAEAPEAVETAAVPEAFAVANYPNPFNPTTTLRVDVPETATVTLVVYDVLGREVARLLDGPVSAGTHTLTWNAGDLPSGMYLYLLRAGTVRLTGHMVLAK